MSNLLLCGPDHILSLSFVCFMYFCFQLYVLHLHVVLLQ